METDWPLIAVRFALFAVLGGQFGFSTFSFINRRTTVASRRLAGGPWIVASAVVGLLLSTVGLGLLAAHMAGSSIMAVDRDTLETILWETPIGTAWKIRVIALVMTALAALSASQSSSRQGLVIAGSAVALATLSWTGHGAMDEGVSGWVHLAADVVHLIAAGAWIGALLGLILLVTHPVRKIDTDHLQATHRALSGFSAVGTIIVGTIVVTGLINSWFLVGPANVAALGSNLYGQLLLAKLTLFAGMLGLAWLNRFRLTPALEQAVAKDDHVAAITALRLSVGFETGSAVFILALVAWLGTLEPPVSMNL